MTETLLSMLVAVTAGLALALLLRRPARHAFGAGPAFTLWLLPVVLALAPLLPRGFAPAATWSLPVVLVTAQPAHAGAPAGLDWPLVLAVAWIAGAAIALLRLLLHYARLRRAARPVPAAWLRWLRDAAPDVNPRRVRVHPEGPAVLWSLPRSLILLPPDFGPRDANDATPALILRHELTHARRGDAYWSLAMEMASALLWFHPLAWLARPRFRLDQELACDAAALRALPRRGAGYARALLDSVVARPAPVLIPWLAEPQLKERIAMISRIPPGARRRRTGFLAIAALLAGGIALGAGTTTVRAAAPASSTAPPAVDVTYKNRNPPRYPVEAIQKGEQGTVMLDITVDASGNVAKVVVDPKKTTAAPILQTAAIAAASDWKFHPGRKNGHAVGGVVTVPVKFSLRAWKVSGPHPCPPGYHYQQGSQKQKSYKCIAAPPASPSSVRVRTP